MRGARSAAPGVKGRRGRARVAPCHKGCSHCCHLPLAMRAIERTLFILVGCRASSCAGACTPGSNKGEASNALARDVFLIGSARFGTAASSSSAIARAASTW
jgi:hypothetical protein